MQKHVHVGDLVKSFQTKNYYLLAKHRLRYSRERAPRSLGGKFNSIFTSLLNGAEEREVEGAVVGRPVVPDVAGAVDLRS